MIFTQEEENKIVAAIQAAERGTSGEVRVYVEDFCMSDSPVERAAEVFLKNSMFSTANRNAVLVYIAEKSRQFAIWGDSGIHEKVGVQFWEKEKILFREYLQHDEAAEGIVRVIGMLGDQLHLHFPSDSTENDNELPDHIIYG